MATEKQTDLQIALQEMAGQVKGKEVTKIALEEGVDPSTVYSYLKGKVPIVALGKSILSRCRRVVMQREQSSNAA